MKSIKIRNVQAVRERLLEQISILRRILEETEKMELRLRGQSLMEETVCLLRKSQEELMEEIRGCQDMAECLQKICELCLRTEETITEVYDLERIVYPKTTFGTSSLTKLEPFSDIMLFQGL